YSTPLPTTKFSAYYFTELTFQTASQLEYPSIYAPKTTSGWTFTNEVPSDISSHLVVAQEVIPHIDDLTPILKEMEAAYHRGSRSVVVTLTIPGATVNSIYSFAKIQTLKFINNNKAAVQSARALVEYFSSTSVLTKPLLDQFIAHRIHSKIFGFHVTNFPLWKLSCLLGEEWLHEDVLNALSELLYFSTAARSDDHHPSILILPTS
ncbi:hypothetical protein B0H11DRAFT_1667258, partial [Mycena galericulata]